MTETQRPALGHVEESGDQATLTYTRHLRHPPEVVWESSTEPDELSKWYLRDSRIEPRLGGRIDFSYGPGRVTGTILVWDPPHVFEHELIVDRPGFPKGEYGVIRWELTREGDGTTLKLTHRELPKQGARNFAAGMHAILDRLEAHLNKSPMPDWQERQDEVRASYLQRKS